MVRTHLFWRENANIEIYFFYDEAENTLVMVPWLEAREQRFEPVYLDLAKIDARILKKDDEKAQAAGGGTADSGTAGGTSDGRDTSFLDARRAAKAARRAAAEKELQLPCRSNPDKAAKKKRSSGGKGGSKEVSLRGQVAMQRSPPPH